MDSPARIIRPSDRLADGTLSSLRNISEELHQFRDHISTTFWQDFRNQYQGSFFGVVWNIVLPLAPILLYTLLARHRVIPLFADTDPGSYVALGAAIWFLLAGCIQQPVQTVRARNIEVMKISLPLSAMIMSSFAQLLFETLVRIVFFVVVVLLSSTAVKWTAVLLPILLLPAVMMFFGIGLVLGVANVIYTDVSRVVQIGLQYGIFLSGVIFPVSSLPMSDILQWNPANIFIESARTLAFMGIPDHLYVLAAYSGVGVLMLLLGFRVFYVMEYRLRGIL